MVSEKNFTLLVVSSTTPFFEVLAIIFGQDCLRIYVFIISDPMTRFIKWKFPIFEHTKKEKMSHVYKHLHESEICFHNYNNKCFSILDTASTKFQRKLKEGLYIGWEMPELNKQIKHIYSSLAI